MRQHERHRGLALAAKAAAGVGLGGLGAVGVGSLGLATYFARKVVTPDVDKPDNVVVRAVDRAGGTVTLDANEDTVAPGQYGLWLQGGEGHARLGEVVAGQAAGSVTRTLHGVDRGVLDPGGARWNQYYFAGSPQLSLGLPTEDVVVTSDVGDLPTWLVPPAGGPAGPDGGGSGRWAVLVHGRGARRDECLRAVPVLHGLGLTCLIPHYRNDVGAPPSRDGRHNLGLSEWRDVEAAMLYAVRHGAQEIVLVGWSAGGAIVLQTLDRSWLSERVSSIVLDAPVIDWADVLRHQARINKVPLPVESLSRVLIGRPATRRLVGVHEPIDVAKTNWVARADELDRPTLLIHSEADEFVPCGPSAELARRRPDLVRFETDWGARHTKEWNVDPERWDGVVRDFLTARG
ncbi:MAG TPA: alpha/beta fold hydrolase [Segeticoccus sp.]|uniref:alpha/beta hydrolase n=1 Tax=Segeticoccus sp. TaxID=2706531 RepID=UPI002D7E66C0|nr:alpha/beta fold hydrolase [Segeticoccus sp.]HET8600534.1 alpha/beta fold hydrolase [Segeticoccus sp.]